MWPRLVTRATARSVEWLELSTWRPILADRGGEAPRGGGDGLGHCAGFLGGRLRRMRALLRHARRGSPCPVAESCSLPSPEPGEACARSRNGLLETGDRLFELLPLGGEPARLLALLLGAQRFTLGPARREILHALGHLPGSRRCAPLRGPGRDRLCAAGQPRHRAAEIAPATRGPATRLPRCVKPTLASQHDQAAMISIPAKRACFLRLPNGCIRYAATSPRRTHLRPGP